jgi:hypothetical protein
MLISEDAVEFYRIASSDGLCVSLLQVAVHPYHIRDHVDTTKKS